MPDDWKRPYPDLPVMKPRLGGQYCEAFADAICGRIEDGESLTSVAKDPALPSAPTIYKWMADHTGFGARVRAAQRAAAGRVRRIPLDSYFDN